MFSVRARRLLALLILIGFGLAVAVPAMATPTDEPSPEDRRKISQVFVTLSGVTIALDPGHNGGNGANPTLISQQVADGRGGMKSCNTSGTQTSTGYPEHAFNFDVAVRLQERLERLGATVVLTRTDDEGVGPCVDVRGRFAEDADADLMVSIHANGSENPADEGFFVILAEPAISESQGQPSRELAESLLDALAAGGFTPSTAVQDQLSYRDDIATLNFARRPAVLVELGEMRNPDEAAVMQTEEGRQRYADALTRGVLAWVRDGEFSSTSR